MLSTKLRSIRFAGIFLFVAAICILFVFPVLKGTAAASESDASPQALNRYGQIASVLSKCNTVSQVTAPTIKAPFSPAASLCINGSLAGTDQPWTRPGVTTNNGTGLGACPGSVPAFYDFYSFNLSGATCSFPTLVRMTLCGPAGCLNAGNRDLVMYLYRDVAGAGDDLSGNGGLGGVFSPASPCNNLRGSNDSLSGGGSNIPPNGNSCSQLALLPQTCEGTCTGATSLAGMHRKLGNGRFTLLISSASTDGTDQGVYNLYVEAASTGCVVATAPTSGNGNISGRVVTSTGRGISNAMLTVTGSEIAPFTLRTNGFGYYNFPNLPVGATYIVTVESKMYTFANPSQTVNLDDSAADINFVSEQ